MGTKYMASIAIKPSETIKESFEMSNMNIRQFANKLKMDVNSAKRLLDGEKSIDQSLAKRLENVFGVSATFWLNLQKNYNETVSRLNVKYRRHIKNMSKGEELDDLIKEFIMGNKNIKIKPSTSLNDLYLVLNTIPDKIKIIKNKNGYYVIGNNIKLKGDLCECTCKVLMLNRLHYLIRDKHFSI